MLNMIKYDESSLSEPLKGRIIDLKNLINESSEADKKTILSQVADKLSNLQIKQSSQKPSPSFNVLDFTKSLDNPLDDTYKSREVLEKELLERSQQNPESTNLDIKFELELLNNHIKQIEEMIFNVVDASTKIKIQK